MTGRSVREIGVGLAVGLFVTGCAGTPRAPVNQGPPTKTVVSTEAPKITPPSAALRSRGHCALAEGLLELTAPKTAASPEVSRDNLHATIGVLADPKLHGRAAGSEDNRRVAGWIADRFAAYGLSPVTGTDYCLPFERNDLRDQNVVAYLHRNEAPDAPVVLVGAHYDAQGEIHTEIYPGADDNASGVAALLEIARLSSARKTGPDMIFVAFGAEERGLLGAKAYVAAPSVPFARMLLMLNLDMVGRPMLDGSPLRLFVPRADETIGYVIGPKDKAHTDEILQHAAEKEERPIIGIPEVVLTRLGFGSDSVPFSPHVPTIFLSTGDHRDYHQPTDTQEKVDYDQLIRAVKLSLAIVDETKAR